MDDTTKLRAANDRQAMKLIRLSCALQELEEIAEDKYDGPEDRTWGPILNIIRTALAG